MTENSATPTATSDIEQGKRNLDQFGYTVHEGLLSPSELRRIRDRLLEQAELECEQGVATFRLPDDHVIGNRQLGKPPEGAQPAWQALLALPNKGR